MVATPAPTTPQNPVQSQNVGRLRAGAKRNIRRVTAIALISVAGSTAVGGVASALTPLPPIDPGMSIPHPGAIPTETVNPWTPPPFVPELTIPDFPDMPIPGPDLPELPKPTFLPPDLPDVTIPIPPPPPADGPDDGPLLEKVPFDPCDFLPDECPPGNPGDPEDDPGDNPEDDPGDNPEDEPGDDPEDEPGDEPETDVESRQVEREVPETPARDNKVDETALAYTGNDSTLPYVGAGLIALGGLSAGAALLLRHNREHAEDGRA